MADNRRPGNGDGGNGPGDQISVQDVARKAMDHLQQVAGQAPEMVTAVNRDDGGWRVTVELLELARIPDSTDILGCYELTLDPAGEPISYRRTRRYARSQVGEE